MKLLSILSAATSEATSSSSGGTKESATESLKKIFQSPVLYIVLGAIVLLVIVVYLIRRFVKPTKNATTIIVRGGKIRKVLEENDKAVFLTPFRDSVGAIITKDNKVFSSDKLFINNGPDALYKIHYDLTYRVLDPKAFYPYAGRINELLNTRLNDSLRLYADQGNALVLVKDYRENASVILEVINKAIAEYQVEAVEFKINIIEPLGRNN